MARGSKAIATTFAPNTNPIATPTVTITGHVILPRKNIIPMAKIATAAITLAILPFKIRISVHSALASSDWFVVFPSEEICEGLTEMMFCEDGASLAMAND